MRTRLLLLLASVFLAANLSAAVTIPECVQIGVTQVEDELPAGCVVVNGQIFGLQITDREPKIFEMTAEIATNDFILTGSVLTQAEPFIDYGFAFKNLTGGPLAFAIFLATPYLLGPYSIGDSTHSGSVTDAAPAGGGPDGSVTITPAAGGVHQPDYDGTAFGAIAGGCILAGAAGFSDNCPAAAVNMFGIPIATAAAGTLNLALGATVSAGDRYTFNGSAVIRNAIPEPGTYALVSLALASLILLRRTRSS